FGVSLGIAVFMTLSLFIQNENSYEKSHINLNNIYRLEQTRKDGDAIRKMCGTPPPLSLVIDKDIAGIKKCTRMTGQQSGVIRQEDGTKTTVDNIIFADKEFLEVFTYPVVHGVPGGNLDQPFMAVITKEYSKRIFGTENSIGERIWHNNRVEIEIQSVVEQLSDNSHLNFSILISFETLVSIAGEEIINQDWGSNWPHNYVLLDKKISPETVNSNLDEYLKKYQGESSENRLYLKPLKDIHLHSDVVDEFAQTGSYQNNLIYVVIAILIILIACINYINLTIAYSAARIKEIGIRKVIGANRKNLIGQLMGESSISILISMFIALILIELFIPFFNTLVNRNLYVNYQENWQFITLFISISLGLGLITGLLPAKTISGFQPLSMARKIMFEGMKGLYFRYGLVLFQFFITISLIA
ncbi:MAG: ABC transporter permease, partial [Cyclobacteriaceae bacterium]|nr:ABC transporter permease [Cyclobacteriaceae bacterium]